MSTLSLPAPANTSDLGAYVRDGGTQFSLWAPRATRVELVLVAEDRTQTNVDMDRGEDGVWWAFVDGVGDGQRYGYRVHGAWSPETGQRFNPAKLLLDPYARAITGGVDYAGPIRDHTAESDYLPDPTDSFAAVPLSVVVKPTPPPTPIARRRPMDECVIYETHVKGYTLLHPQVPEHLRGTFAGLAYPAVIEHLTSIGINTVELLPVQHFVSEPFIIGRGLTNFWGYNTLGFFAPHGAFSSQGSMGRQVDEFKEMVSALHEAGIEVILDVVYNHTGEGGHEGPTLSFRGIDHGGYYRLTDDMHNDYDVTGCGNSVDTSQPGVLRMILDSLRYWVTEMGVDGFRFDLATELIRDASHHVDQNHALKQAVAADPVLSQVKMIAEPWDLGPFGYQVGRWGHGWYEWNDRFRGFTRDYWRSYVHGVQELATRLCGSPDLFDHDGRPASSSVNFVTAHDGFTLRDVVTYNVKHNAANGESNRDGADDNRSWNCGAEGETENPDVIALRHRQAKNLMATLLLSHGVPMITAGDEMGRTQQGNNNAYCQDSPISWVRWDTLDQWRDLADLTATLLKLREQYPVLRSAVFPTPSEIVDADGIGLGRHSIAWFNGWGAEMNDGDWYAGDRRLLGMYLSDRTSAFLVWFNSGHEDAQVALPDGHWARSYSVIAHTGEPDEYPDEQVRAGTRIPLKGRTVLVLQADVPDQAPPAPPRRHEPGACTLL